MSLRLRLCLAWQHILQTGHGLYRVYKRTLAFLC